MWFIVNTGASGIASFRSKNGDEPILRSPNTTPRIMDVRKACTNAKTVSMGASHLAPAVRVRMMPNIAFQNIQSKKLPSCPSQKHEIMYCTGNASDE